MLKNVFLGIYTLLLVIMILAFVTNRLAWVCPDERSTNEPMEILQQAIDMHKPEVLKVGETEILYVPTSKLRGKNWSVKPTFYTYEEGKLKRIDLDE